MGKGLGTLQLHNIDEELVFDTIQDIKLLEFSDISITNTQYEDDMEMEFEGWVAEFLLLCRRTKQPFWKRFRSLVWQSASPSRLMFKYQTGQAPSLEGQFHVLPIDLQMRIENTALARDIEIDIGQMQA
jgi:hypothetical protein